MQQKRGPGQKGVDSFADKADGSPKSLGRKKADARSPHRRVARSEFYPLEHRPISELKNTRQIAEDMQDKDLIVIRGDETVGYLVSPRHYEELVSAEKELAELYTDAHLQEYARRHGSLEGLDQAYEEARQGLNRATPEEVAQVFGL